VASSVGNDVTMKMTS